MTIKKFWKHVEDALTKATDAYVYYALDTLCIHFADDKLIALDLDGTGYTQGGFMYLPDHIYSLVVARHNTHIGKEIK